MLRSSGLTLRGFTDLGGEELADTSRLTAFYGRSAARSNDHSMALDALAWIRIKAEERMRRSRLSPMAGSCAEGYA